MSRATFWVGHLHKGVLLLYFPRFPVFFLLHPLSLSSFMLHVQKQRSNTPQMFSLKGCMFGGGWSLCDERADVLQWCLMTHLGGGSRPQKRKLLFYFMSSQDTLAWKAKWKWSKLIVIFFSLNHLYQELILCNYWGVTLNPGQDFVAFLTSSAASDVAMKKEVSVCAWGGGDKAALLPRCIRWELQLPGYF